MRNVPFLVEGPSDLCHLVLDHSDYPEMDLSKTVLLFNLDSESRDVIAIAGTEADSPNDLLGQLQGSDMLKDAEVAIVVPDSWSGTPYFIDVLSTLRNQVLDVISINPETRQGFSFLCEHENGETCNTRNPVAPCDCGH